MSTVRLPTSKVVVLLLGLCQQGVELKACDDRGDGRLWFHWEGRRAGRGDVGIKADDEEALAALRRASSSARAYVELLAILVCVALLAGVSGAWQLERVASLIYGRRHRSSHRERQLPPLRGWLALLERGWWQLDTRTSTATSKSRKRNKEVAGQRGEVISGPLVTIERRSRTSATVVPAGDFLAALSSGFAVTVPDTIFRLPEAGHTNPEGNLPSLATKARVRLAAAIAARWRQATSQSVAAETLLADFAGLDLGRVERRRHVRQWAEALFDNLQRAHAAGAPGLDGPPADERPILRARLRLLIPRRNAEPDGSVRPKPAASRFVRRSRSP